MRKLFLAAAAAVSVFAASFDVGDTIPYTSFSDQFEKPLTVTRETQKVIIVYDKQSGQDIDKFMRQNKGYLQQNDAVLLSDVSRVPGFVMSFFMLPKFQEYEYQMGLIKEEQKAADLPRKGNKITIVHLDALNVTSIEYQDKLKEPKPHTSNR
ncbi:MAG: hypothetical protein ACQERK_01745 [Campylobacterota bacterium]